MNTRGRRIIIIAYDFPPRVKSGTYRPMRFARALSDSGWEVVVVTASEPEDQRRIDSTLLGEWTSAVKVISTLSLSSLLDPLQRIFDRLGLGGLIFRMRKVILFPDEKLLWIPSVLLALLRLRPGQGDVVLTTSPPWSVHLVGLVLRRFGSFKWVADHRDPWTQNPHFRGKGKVAGALHRYVEDICHRYSDAIITASRTQREELVRHFDLPVVRN
jgi:hypothetical protein